VSEFAEKIPNAAADAKARMGAQDELTFDLILES
jgi:hypothetical protein